MFIHFWLCLNDPKCSNANCGDKTVGTDGYGLLIRSVVSVVTSVKPLYLQESPAIADKPARRESLPKIAPIRRATTLSLTILAYLHAFSCCCVRNLRNREKFTENSNLWSSRSSKVIDLGANRKPICDLLYIYFYINSNFSRICYRFRDIHG